MATDLGDLYRLTFTLTSPAGGNVNADTMTLTITLPDSTATAPVTVPPLSTGVYQYDYLTVQPGRHLARWVGTGANPGAYSEAFDVLPANPPYLVSLADVKAQLNITGTQNDEELREFIGAATAVVEKYKNETIVRRTITEEAYLTDYAWGFGQNYGQPAVWGVPALKLALKHSPALSLISVARLDGTMTWDVSLLHLNSNGIVDVMFGNPLSGHIAVTYTAGYAVIPNDVTLAAKIIVQHLWETQRGARGGPRAGGLSDTTILGTGHMGYAIPNRALELLGSPLQGFA